jgi:hypothetical protein
VLELLGLLELLRNQVPKVLIVIRVIQSFAVIWIRVIRVIFGLLG